MAHETVVVGGFASCVEQYQTIAGLLQQHYGSPFRGVNFSSALAEPDRFAEVIDGNAVKAHSGGAYAVKLAMEHGAVPSRLDMVAPSIPERVRSLVWRGALIGWHDPAERQQIEQKVTNFSAMTEIKRHPVRNFGAIARLGHFASLDFAEDTHLKGVPTSIGFMEQDGLFDLASIDPHQIECLREAGVALRAIRGTHTRFTANPVGTLEELRIAPELTRPISTLDPEVSFRGTIAPTLGSLASRFKAA